MDTRILYQLCIVLITHLDNASAFATLLIYGRLSYAVENHDFILSCESSEEAATIVWTRDGADISAAYVESNVCKSADTGTGLLSNYRYNCTDNKTFNLIIPGDRIFQEDGSKWQCKEAGGGVSSNVFILTVTKESESDSKNVLGLVIGSGFGCIAVIFLVVISVIFIIQGMKKPSKATYGKRNNSDTNQHIDGRLQTSIDQRANDKIHFEDVYENAGADIESDHREYNLGASHDTTINSVIESEDTYENAEKTESNNGEDISYQDVDIQMYEDLDKTNKDDSQYDSLQEHRNVCDTTEISNDRNAAEL